MIRCPIALPLASLCLLLLSFWLLSAAPISAQDTPAAPEEPLALVLTPLTDTLDEAVGITTADDARVFVIDKRGLVLIWSGGRLLTEPYLDIRDRVLYTGEFQSELGLLSMAFHPDYDANGFVFVTYVDRNGDSVISRFSVSANANRALRSSERVLLTVPQPGENHNVNHLQFGPDGYLYISSGDGGYIREPRCSGQETDHLLGKILRLDVDQNVETPPYHGIPASNPFVGSGGPRDEVWALGLRNPWRMSFDRTTGDLFIADVGHSEREEINREAASSAGGRNYGFKLMEGTMCRGSFENCPSNVPPCGDPAYIAPIFDYGHSSRQCAVIGGYVYRGSRIPRLFGHYVFGDFCGAMGTLSASNDGWTFQSLLPNLPNLVDFAEDPSGELFLLAGTTLYRLDDANEASSVAFASESFETTEGAGEALVVLERRGGADGELTLEVRTQDESALSGVDFSAVTAQITWTDGDAENKRVSVPILQDTLIEGAETLLLELSLVSGFGTIGVPGTTRLTIQDDDLTSGPCVPDNTTLCLNDDRFLVRTRWSAPDGRLGMGRAEELTDETGTFWFFNPDNIEVVIKVLAGCFDPFNHFWVFAAGLTNIEVEMTVLDTESGLLKQYGNPQGQPFLPIQDTRAFDTCP